MVIFPLVGGSNGTNDAKWEPSAGRLNDEASNENETTGEFTKEDVYQYSFYLILMLIAVVIVQEIRG